MRFETIEIERAEGAILAHTVRLPGITLKKAHRLTAKDCQTLAQMGVTSIIGALLEPGDVGEDEAAARLAGSFGGAGIRIDGAFTGRVNLFAEVAGVLRVDKRLIDAVNMLDEAITVATLPDLAAVEAGQMVATIKIIPFAAPEAALTEALAIAADGQPLTLAPFRPKRAWLIQTELSATSAKMLDKTVRITADRLQAVGGELVGESRCDHEKTALAAAIEQTIRDRTVDLLLVAGASAITDRRDVLPAGIVAAGGSIEHFGMPVDPGNLLLLARLGQMPILGLPGCARSPKLNGFDWVLERLAADMAVTKADIIGMGVGGLLVEIPSRPQPREVPIVRDERQRIGAVILAAGRSSRMGERNKLLIPIDGKPMVRHAVGAAIEAGVTDIVVVTGHMRPEVEAALAGRPVRFVHNPDFAQGLAGSLKLAVAALGGEVTGALVLLGDMPRVTGAHLRQLVRAFDPLEGRSIIVPTFEGKRGNPVLWARSFFGEFQALHGDVGARHLIGENEAVVQEVAMTDASSLIDVDTPEALRSLEEGVSQ